MPFTPSHAVVALPFVRTPLIPAAIAVGAMTPDLPLFVRATPITYGGTHAWGMLPLTMLLALTLLLVWRCVIRPAVRELMPMPIAGRLPSAWDAGFISGIRETLAVGWRGGVLLIASLAIGVASHILWDSFTHEGRAGLSLIPVLDEQWGPLLGYKWFQHGSGVLGLLILAVYAALWLRRRPVSDVHRVLPNPVRLALWLSLPAALMIASVIGYAVFGPFTAEFTPQHLAYRVLPPACAIWAVLALALCISVPMRRRRRSLRDAL